MKIKILKFEVKETVPMTEDLNIFVHIWRNWFGPPIESLYHFDTMIYVDEDYLEYAKPLDKGDVLQLPNDVRLTIWNTDRIGGRIRAKTTKFVEQDIRNYHPMEMYFVYPRVHGHLKDVV